MGEILKVRNLQREFPGKYGTVKAVDHVDFEIYPGECLGLIGESGSGKSTIANLVIGLEKTNGGEINYLGTPLENGGKAAKEALMQMSMVFQNPRSSFNPRIRIERNIAEGLVYHEHISKEEQKERVLEKMEMVELPPEYIHKYAWQLSGGECQRAAIARAIISNPKLLICDEVTSALDVSVQEQILTLLNRLKRQMGMSLLFITHDLALAGSFCDRILVMYHGKIVESGSSHEVITNPKDEYTKLLINSVFSVSPRKNIRN